MTFVRILSVVTILAGLVAVAIVSAPPVSGQSPRRAPDPPPSVRQRVDVLDRGSWIGASVRDLETFDRREGTGVSVEEVRPGGPADKAGLRPGDVVTRFDGETVRSARQFGRLVQETPAGRAVTATVLRDDRQTDVSVTPEEGPGASVFVDGDRFARAFDRLRNIPFNFNLDLDLDLPRLAGRGRLGVTVEELTPQLAAYFGAKDGVLVASVADNSPASRAGLKAGDVIHSVNGQTVTSRADITRALRSAGANADVTIGIVRDKKDTTVKARLDDEGMRRPAARPI